jgi:SAM-dependent methyltransferase
LLPLRELIRRELPRERRTLELGCGPGIFADLFAPDEYVGVDPSARYIDHARRTRPGIFLVGDLRRVPLPEDRFDQVLIVERMHPLADPDAGALLAEAIRMLVGGGRALVVERVLGAGGLAGLLREHWGRPSREAEDYRRLFRPLGRVESWETLRSGTGHYLATVLGKEGPRAEPGGGRVDSES